MTLRLIIWILIFFLGREDKNRSQLLDYKDKTFNRMTLFVLTYHPNFVNIVIQLQNITNYTNYSPILCTEDLAIWKIGCWKLRLYQRPIFHTLDVARVGAYSWVWHATRYNVHKISKAIQLVRYTTCLGMSLTKMPTLFIFYSVITVIWRILESQHNRMNDYQTFLFVVI